MTRTEAAQFLLRGRAFIALIVLAVFFALVESAFLTGANIEILIKQTALNAILAIGMTFVILTGGIDLSVGSIVGFTGIIAGLLINQGLEIGVLGVVIYPHTWMVLVISLAAGTFLGAISGFIITRFNVAPFIATLGMLLVARGLAGLHQRRQDVPQPDRQGGAGQHRLPRAGHRGSSSASCPGPSSSWSSSPSWPGSSPRGRPSDEPSTRWAATSAPRSSPACASTAPR